MTESLKPVFIIGGSRTGSEMLKTMLSASKELDFVDELFLLSPAWLHTDLQTNIERHVGNLQNDDALDRLLEFLYSGVPYGWFWSVVDKELDREMLREELCGSRLDLSSIFTAAMKVHARMRNKRGIGAKFPLHYSYVKKLLEWFPECRLIHTTRNPKGVYASQAAKYVANDDGPIKRNFDRFQHFVHINIQVHWTARLHRRLNGFANYKLVRYEDIVQHPEKELRQICEYLDVDYVSNMLDPHQYGSSFDTIGSGHGVSSSSLERWRTSISPWTARFMDVAHRSASRSFGYTDQNSVT